MRRTRHLVVTAYLGSLVAGGCAVNDRGMVRVRHRESTGAHVVDLDAWGVHLIATATDAGLTVGHSRRTYVYPGSGRGGARLSLSELAGRPDVRRLTDSRCDPCPHLAQLGTPLAMIIRTAGVSLDANPHRTGIAIGARTRAALSIPSDRSVVIYLTYGTGDGARQEAYVAGGTP